MWCSESRGARRALLAGLAILPMLVAGCGFEPLYDPGGPAAGMLGRVAVAPLDGAAGFALRERLTQRLGVADAAAYQLEIDLEVRQSEAAITRDAFVTRFNVVGEADFRLVPAGGGAPVLADRVRAITGYSAPASETSSAFAARVAMQDAEARLARTLADLIMARLALAAGELAP